MLALSEPIRRRVLALTRHPRAGGAWASRCRCCSGAFVDAIEMPCLHRDTRHSTARVRTAPVYGRVMYAKVLNANGPVPIPMLLATHHAGQPIVEQLLARGWSTYGGKPIEDKGAELQIMPDHLNIVVDSEVLLHDPNGDSVSPPGWWEAVNSFDNRVLLVVLPDSFPLNATDTPAALFELLDSPSTAQGFVDIVHV